MSRQLGSLEHQTGNVALQAIPDRGGDQTSRRYGQARGPTGLHPGKRPIGNGWVAGETGACLSTGLQPASSLLVTHPGATAYRRGLLAAILSRGARGYDVA